MIESITLYRRRHAQKETIYFERDEETDEEHIISIIDEHGKDILCQDCPSVFSLIEEYRAHGWTISLEESDMTDILTRLVLADL